MNAADTCRNHWHTKDCRNATELAQFPHKMIDADYDWIEGDLRCEYCFAWRATQLEQPCGEHPDRPPTLSFNYPTCMGCYKEVTHDGDSFVCETCKVYWSPQAPEGEHGEPFDDDEITYACSTLSEGEDHK